MSQGESPWGRSPGYNQLRQRRTCRLHDDLAGSMTPSFEITTSDQWMKLGLLIPAAVCSSLFPNLATLALYLL
jgi:hypothetical protein